jgi:hypothetical protein
VRCSAAVGGRGGRGCWLLAAGSCQNDTCALCGCAD